MPASDSDQQKIDDLKRQRAQAIDDALATFTASLEAVLALWPKQIRGLLDSLSSHGVSSAMWPAFLKSRLPKQLETLGYYDLSREAIAKYSDAIDATMEQVEAAGFKPEQLSAYDPYDLRLLQSLDVDRLTRAGENAAFNISENATQAVILGQTAEETDAAIEKEISELQTYAVRTVDTGTNVTDRVVGWHLWGQLTKTFKYAGPNDLKTRRFCRAHIGVSHSMKEWMKMKNDAAGPWSNVWIHGGGINCRHWFNPVVSAK